MPIRKIQHTPLHALRTSDAQLAQKITSQKKLIHCSSGYMKDVAEEQLGRYLHEQRRRKEQVTRCAR